MNNELMQGYYTADGKTKILEVPFDANFIKIVNLTQTAAAGAGQVVEAFWQEGMAYGMRYTKTAVTGALATDVLAANTAITKVNTGDNPLSAAIATTGVTADAPAKITMAATAGLYENDIVRIQTTPGATQLNGMDFTIRDITLNTSVELAFGPTVVVSANAGSIYRVKYDKLVYPRTRFITNITQAAQAVITLSVTHEYSVGDYVRLFVGPEYGMTEANLKEVKVVDTDIDLAANTNTITVDLDTRSYTAFTFPVTGTTLAQKAEVVPMTGPGTNPQIRGFQLPAGAAAPGGVANDVIYWVAGNSWNV